MKTANMMSNRNSSMQGNILSESDIEEYVIDRLKRRHRIPCNDWKQNYQFIELMFLCMINEIKIHIIGSSH